MDLRLALLGVSCAILGSAALGLAHGPAAAASTSIRLPAALILPLPALAASAARHRRQLGDRYAGPRTRRQLALILARGGMILGVGAAGIGLAREVDLRLQVHRLVALVTLCWLIAPARTALFPAARARQFLASVIAAACSVAAVWAIGPLLGEPGAPLVGWRGGGWILRAPDDPWAHDGDCAP